MGNDVGNAHIGVDWMVPSTFPNTWDTPDTSRAEVELDPLVYNLYRLTADEIAAVERTIWAKLA